MKFLSVNAARLDDGNDSDMDDKDDTKSDSVSSILPAELWLDTLRICATTPHLPAACRSTSSQPGSPLHRIWTHRHIFLDPMHDPKIANKTNSPASKHAEINSWCPTVAQCESHLAYYLKAHAPTSNDGFFECASGLAPEPGHHVPATVFSVAMVEWLFSATGPFGRQSRQNSNKIDVFGALAKVQPDSDSKSDFEEADAAAQVPADAPTASLAPATKQPPRRQLLPTWRLIPDPFLLATFFIRTSQLDLLELTLARMRSLFPALSTSTAPFSLWSRLMLDNRTRRLRSFLSDIVSSNGDPHMSYPTFLCFIALIDWSKPALDVVARVFADSFDPCIAANLVTSARHMMDSILATLYQLTSPASDSSRVLSILDWFQVNNARINLNDFPSLSSRITGSYSIFADVFLLYDLGNVPFLFDNPARHELGSAIVQWVLSGHLDLMHVALENDLLDDEDKGRLMRHAAEKSDDMMMATVAVKCTGGTDELTTVVLHALKTYYAINDPLDPPSMFSALLNTLTTYGPSSLDPTSILIQHSEMWSRRALSIMMIDPATVDALLFPWDYVRYLDQQLSWAASTWTFWPNSVDFLGALIDKCIEEPGMRWDELSAERAATACALRLAAAALKYKLMSGQDEPTELAVVDDTDVGIVEFFASLAAAKIATANASIDSDDDKTTFSQQIPQGVRDLLRKVIQSATSFSPTPACACDPLAAHSAACSVSNLRAIHNLVFDTLYTLDRAFLLEHVAWRHPASVQVWHRFEPAEVASRINVRSTIGNLRAAMCESPADQVADRIMGIVNGLPRLVVESHVFVSGLYALMRLESAGRERKEATKSGLDASRWGHVWMEQIARVTKLPEDEFDEEGQEEEEEGEEEFSLFD